MTPHISTTVQYQNIDTKFVQHFSPLCEFIPGHAGEQEVVASVWIGPGTGSDVKVDKRQFNTGLAVITLA